MAAAAYVAANTGEGDYVLVWGAESALNFMTQRPSPSRYSYQYPLFTPGYATDEMARGFLNDLRQHPPALIVDASVETQDGNVAPLSAATRGRWAAGRAYAGPAALEHVYTYIAARYEPVAVIGEDAWVIYRRITPVAEAGDDVEH